MRPGKSLPSGPIADRIKARAAVTGRGWMLAGVLAVTACGHPGSGPSRTAPADTDLLVARAAIDEYAVSLRRELQAGIAKGPDAAVEICHERAGAIAGEIGRLHDVEIGRTALKVRNPANAPDRWQQATLERFEQAIANAEPPDTIWAYTKSEDGRHRYMQPIMTQPVCTLCHGTALDPRLEATIARLYPADQARGFEPGDLRGAFVVEWK